MPGEFPLDYNWLSPYISSYRLNYFGRRDYHWSTAKIDLRLDSALSIPKGDER